MTAQKYALGAVVFFLLSCGDEGGSPTTSLVTPSVASAIVPETIHVVDQSTLEERRELLQTRVFGSPGIDQLALPTDVRVAHDPAMGKIHDHFGGLVNLQKIEHLDIDTWADSCSLDNVLEFNPYHFIPTVANGKVFLYHEGHTYGYYSGKSTIGPLVAAGYHVLAFSMPNSNDFKAKWTELCDIGGPVTFSYHNNNYWVTPPYNHVEFAVLDLPFRPFVWQIVVALNHVEQRFGLSEFYMTGISGGGWTTLLYSALDPRITKSYPIAGFFPYPWRLRNGSQGDWEQHNDLYHDVGYMDMAIIAASHGRQMAGYNYSDPCCFSGPSPSEFGPLLMQAAANVGGSWNHWMDYNNGAHSISAWMVQKILTDADAP